MIYLILAMLASCMVSVAMRLSEKRADGSLYKLATNYLVCLICGGFSMFTGKTSPTGEGTVFAVVLGAAAGAMALISLWMMQRSISRNGVVLSATFMKLGLLVPMVISFIFFREIPGVLQAVGAAIAVAAIILINYEKGQVSGSRKDLILLLLIDGVGGVMSKLFTELGVPERENLYFVCTFIVALTLSVLMAARRGERLDKWKVLYGVLIGVPNYLSFRLALRALTVLPAVVVYPAYGVGSLLLVTLAGVIFFREKLSKRQVAAIIMILAALAMLNM